MTKLALKTIFDSTEYNLLKRQKQFVLYSEDSKVESDGFDASNLVFDNEKINQGTGYLLPLLKSTLHTVPKQKK